MSASRDTREKVRPDGRWSGAVTRRPLPDSDLEVAELAPELRNRLTRIWLSQAATEARVARSFGIVHASLVALRADPAMIAIAERAIDDEHRHAALCEDVASRYAGRELAPHPELPDAHPLHPDAKSDELRHALYVVGQCALNETFASAYLDLARRGCTAPLPRAALSELLADEVDHARLGWAFVGAASPELRHELSDWLLPLTTANLREWRQVALSEDASLEAHGVPGRADVHDALSEALVGVLVPGFQHVGLDTRALERWASRGAPT